MLTDWSGERIPHKDDMMEENNFGVFVVASGRVILRGLPGKID